MMTTQRAERVLVTPRSLQPEGGHHHPVVQRLADRGLEVVYPERRGPFDAQAMRQMMQEVSAAIVGVDVVDRSVIGAAPLLKVIARFGVACDRVDLQAAKERGIVVTHTPGANAVAVAEYTIGLMLAVMRHLVAYHTRISQGVWTLLQGRELAGKRVSIVGLGHIGRRSPPVVSSMFMESMPTSAAPACSSHIAASAVRKGWPWKYVSVLQCSDQPVCTKTAFPRTSASPKSSGPMARRERSARKTSPARSATCSNVSSARSLPSAYRWKGASMYVPVLPTISIMPMWKEVPSA